MAKFNSTSTTSAVFGGLPTKTVKDGKTYECADAYARDARSDLFLLAAGRFFGEDSFYESASDGADRFRKLVHEVAKTDLPWLRQFAVWLRTSGNMRTAPLVIVAELFRAQHEAGENWDLRSLVPEVIKRADEPGEMIAYWRSRYGRKLPMGLKRGLGDAVNGLYNDYAVLKYDSASRGYRIGDVIDVIHPEPANAYQAALYQYVLDVRHNRENPRLNPDFLSMIAANRELMAVPVKDRRKVLLSEPDRLKAAGVTWEQVAGWLQGPMDGPAWAAVIPSMGYMARLRNLRNFEQAGVDSKILDELAAYLSSEYQVAKSKQFPFRFLSAYKELVSDRFRWPLEQALNLAVNNIPVFSGSTLVLIDTSASMSSMGLSAKSKVHPVDIAALFGIAIAVRNPGSEVHGFANDTFSHKVPAGTSVLQEVARFSKRIGEKGHGTAIAHAIQKTYKGHDRVIVISDEQTQMEKGYYSGHGNVTDALPKKTPLYAFNVGGYAQAMMDAGSPNRIQLGGITDATFRLIPTIEASATGAWPWE